MTSSILLATDLDRTILPNGDAPESPEAQARLHALVRHPSIVLVYVSGRSQSLLQEAIQTYHLPIPQYAIGDVGTSLFTINDSSWNMLEQWQHTIATDWNGYQSDDIAKLFTDIPELTLQEASKQTIYKLSYYAPQTTNRDALIQRMQQRLDLKKIRASLIWSIDEQARIGLMDVLPLSATKLHALQFLRASLDIPEAHTVFCGDSGNDLPALTSGLQAVLVANARPDVREEALAVLRTKKQEQMLYLAQGDFMGMNGNYSAGVLEGVAHFFPEAKAWMHA